MLFQKYVFTWDSSQAGAVIFYARSDSKNIAQFYVRAFLLKERKRLQLKQRLGFKEITCPAFYRKLRHKV